VIYRLWLPFFNSPHAKNIGLDRGSLMSIFDKFGNNTEKVACFLMKNANFLKNISYFFNVDILININGLH